MKTPFTLLAIVVATLPALCFAAKTGKGKPKRQPPAAGLSEALKPFDKNSNQQIDGDEVAAAQQAFAALRRLDKNANGEIEASEIASSGAPSVGSRTDGARSRRAIAGLKKVDANGNHRIDADEIAGLEKMLASGPGEMMKRLDQNSNGKLEEAELARLNKRLEEGGDIGRRGAGKSPSPSSRMPPEKPAEAAKPAETIKPAEKTEKPAEGEKATEKKIEFGS